MIIISIDPGTTAGAMCINYTDTDRIDLFKITGEHPTRFWSIVEIMDGFTEVGVDVRFVVEDVPISCGKNKGIGSVKLNKQAGYILGYLEGKGMKYELVTPKKWQKGLQKRTGDKGKDDLWGHAKLRYPELKIYKYSADAVLIMDWYYSKLKCGGLA